MSWKIFFIGFIIAVIGAAVFNNAAKADVTEACRDDYITYCSDHQPYTKPGNDCMRSNLKNLNKGCQSALRTRYVNNKRSHVKSTVRYYLRRYGVID